MSKRKTMRYPTDSPDTTPVMESEGRRRYIEADSIKEIGAYTLYHGKSLPIRIAIVRAGLRGKSRVARGEWDRVNKVFGYVHGSKNKTGARRLVAVLYDDHAVIMPDEWTVALEQIDDVQCGRYDLRCAA